jgi:hypothetical protein
MILIVTYDLRSPKDYHDLYEVVKLQGKWWHYMASTWLLSTTKEPQQVVDAMLPHMDPMDLLFVCELTPKFQGRLPQQAWDWINTELKPIFPWPFDTPTGTAIPLSSLAGVPISPFAPPTMPETHNPWAPPVPGGKPDPFSPFLFPPTEKKK